MLFTEFYSYKFYYDFFQSIFYKSFIITFCKNYFSKIFFTKTILCFQKIIYKTLKHKSFTKQFCAFKIFFHKTFLKNILNNFEILVFKMLFQIFFKFPNCHTLLLHAVSITDSNLVIFQRIKVNGNTIWCSNFVLSAIAFSN